MHLACCRAKFGQVGESPVPQPGGLRNTPGVERVGSDTPVKSKLNAPGGCQKQDSRADYWVSGTLRCNSVVTGVSLADRCPSFDSGVLGFYAKKRRKSEMDSGSLRTGDLGLPSRGRPDKTMIRNLPLLPRRTRAGADPPFSRCRFVWIASASAKANQPTCRRIAGQRASPRSNGGWTQGR